MQALNDIPVLDDLDAPKQVAVTSSGKRNVYLETYGCQMNVSDSEIVASVLRENGYGLTHDESEADIVLINTCAIRENAEQKVRRRLDELRSRIEELDRSQPTLVTCHSGLRAHVAVRMLLQHGFNDVKNLTGGMMMRKRAVPESTARA